MAREVIFYACDTCDMAYAAEGDAEDCCRLPERLLTPNINRLLDLVTNYVEKLADGEMTKDIEHQCYETLMKAFYGPDIFRWINEKIKDL